MNRLAPSSRPLCRGPACPAGRVMRAGPGVGSLATDPRLSYAAPSHLVCVLSGEGQHRLATLADRPLARLPDAEDAEEAAMCSIVCSTRSFGMCRLYAAPSHLGPSRCNKTSSVSMRDSPQRCKFTICLIQDERCNNRACLISSWRETACVAWTPLRKLVAVDVAVTLEPPLQPW
jgi:hypothetical protein